MGKDFRAQLQREQLHYAAQNGSIDHVNDLLKRKYPVNRFDELGNTPLHYAVARGDLDIVDLLIRTGANVNAHDERHIGNTPLSDNIEECSYEIAKRLIDAGADPTIPGWMGLNALHRAENRRDLEASRIRVLLKECVRRKNRK